MSEAKVLPYKYACGLKLLHKNPADKILGRKLAEGEIEIEDQCRLEAVLCETIEALPGREFQLGVRFEF